MNYAGFIKTASTRFLPKAMQSAETLMLDYAETNNPGCIARLYDMFGQDVFYYLLVMTSREKAADIAQLTWVKVIEKRHLFVEGTCFRKWVFTIARNTLFDECKKDARLEYIDNVEHLAGLCRNTTDDMQRFKMALSALPFAQREAFSLQQEGFSLKEISDMCASPVETVKTRLRYARTFIRNFLEDHKHETR